MQILRPEWDFVLTLVLFAASGGIGYASTTLLYDLLARLGRRRRSAWSTTPAS